MQHASTTREREQLFKDPTVQQLVEHVEGSIPEMGGFSLSNIAWVCRGVDIGSKAFLPKVLTISNPIVNINFPSNQRSTMKDFIHLWHTSQCEDPASAH